MKFTLKNPPPKAARPCFFNISKWFIRLTIALVITMFFVSMLITDEDRYFWGAVGLWWGALCSVILFLYITYYLLMHIRSNSWDRQRKKWLLEETRKSRRVLQILQAEFITAADYVNDKNVGNTNLSPLNILMDNDPRVEMQISWQDDGNVMMSRIPFGSEVSDPGSLLPEQFIYDLLKKILTPIAKSLSLFHESKSISILFEVSTGVAPRLLRNVWQRVWVESGITQPVEFVDGSGLAYIDTWLNERIRDESLLLIVALQIAPENPEGTGEAAVALLLGNRLTQKTLEPLALLHRPDCSFESELDKGLEQAAYHVPLNNSTLQHLWQCGLNQTQREAVTILRQSPLLASVKSANIYNVDGSLGQTGCAAPWLAVAAATQAAQKLQVPQLIISSDFRHEAIWSAIVSPMIPPQELDS